MIEAAVVIVVAVACWSVGYRDGRRIGRLEGMVEAEPHMNRPPVHVNSRGVSSVRAADILRSEAGQAELRRTRDAKLTE